MTFPAWNGNQRLICLVSAILSLPNDFHFHHHKLEVFMKAHLLKTLALALVVSIAFTACDEDSDNPITTDPEVAAPTSLMAASDDGAVILSWTPSIDETADNFGSYDIVVLNLATNETGTPITA